MLHNYLRPKNNNFEEDLAEYVKKQDETDTRQFNELSEYMDAIGEDVNYFIRCALIDIIKYHKKGNKDYILSAAYYLKKIYEI